MAGISPVARPKPSINTTALRAMPGVTAKPGMKLPTLVSMAAANRAASAMPGRPPSNASSTDFAQHQAQDTSAGKAQRL